MSPLYNQLFESLQGIGIDPERLGKYLAEQVQEDRKISDVRKEVDGDRVFYDRKDVLSQVELLSIILTTKQNYGMAKKIG